MSRHPQLRAEPALTGSVALFAAAGVWTELHYATTPQPPAYGAYLLTAAAAAVLLLRRDRPVLAAAGCLLCCLGYRMSGYAGFSPGVLIFLACYALGAYRRSVYGFSAALAAWIIPALPPHGLPFFDFSISMPPIGMAATAAIGAAARRRRIEHEAQLRQSAATAEAQLGRRLAEERLQIARELHDVLAHTISVVAVQSSVALDVLDDSPDQAREAMQAVRAAARQAMPELRAALDLLRGSGAPDLRPQPDLSRLPDLVARFGDSGLTVDLTIAPDAADTSPVVQLTAFRIAQESLTNVLRHSSTTSVTATITVDPTTLVVEITDPGGPTDPTRPPDPTTTPGFGLTGMRERAEALGGELHAAPTPEGGFRVLARLPRETP
ncbi:MAG TPA: sensor histidine kinase [Actinocrinis sp.]|nr:sensor histidine kinase [Actinocrinis sp.]